MSFCKYKLRLNTIITEFFGDFSPIYAAKVLLLYEMCKRFISKKYCFTEFFGDFSPIFALNVPKYSIKSLLFPVFTFQFVQCVSIIMLQKVAAIIDKVAADLCLMAREER